jgi:hypothetical protein
MNTRIFLPAPPADQQARSVQPDLRDTERYNRIRDPVFAQLIAQECIDIVSPYAVAISRPGEEYPHPIKEIEQAFWN